MEVSILIPVRKSNLINSVLDSMLNYVMSLFPIPGKGDKGIGFLEEELSVARKRN